MDAFQANNQFRCIGSGCCGNGWSDDDAAVDWAMKCEDGNNDYSIHHRVLAAADKLAVRIPRSYDLIDTNDPWWATDLAKFPPEKHRKACRGYFQKRIPAVPSPARELLIDQYFRESLQATAKASLRILAEMLAYCYWIAKADANDVEFVFASATGADDEVPRFEIAGQDMAVMAGLNGDDVRLWERFRFHSQTESSRLLRGESVGLAEEWVRLVEEERRRRAGGDCGVCNGAST
ncbi:hypothetical protein BKA63DRAFT_532063 [Paraphoma chrysanthemicola]|nr:hypothetical protein BKA63DRAFT_532063 [Paraphoma chrysanthemicola]